MGTKADFYVGTRLGAEWVGSVGYDGHPDRDLRRRLSRVRTERGFRSSVAALLSEPRREPTLPGEGWPWPWEDSHCSDYVYAYVQTPRSSRGLGTVLVLCGVSSPKWETFSELDRRWRRQPLTVAAERCPTCGELVASPRVELPDMSERRASREVVLSKSGLVFLKLPSSS